MNFDQFRFTLRGILFDWIGQTEKALEAYAASFAANPRDVKAARSVAWNHARKQRWAAAADWFGKALELEPEHADTWFNRAYAREQRGDQDGALGDFARATQLNPKHDRAWYGMGLAHAKHGDHAAAAQALEVAAKLQPMNGAAWYALGMARHHNREPEAVEAVLQHLLQYEPQTAKRLVRDAERSDLAPLVAHIETLGSERSG